MKIVDMAITPIAFKDPPLLNSLGVHEPYAIRSVVEIVTDDGFIGLSETYGDRPMIGDLHRAAAVIKGFDPFQLHLIEKALIGTGTGSNKAMGMAPGSVKSRADSRLFAAIEVACLDIQGRAVGRRVCDLIGGVVREQVPFASYLFYKYGSHIDFDEYEPDEFGEVVTAEAMVDLAKHFEKLYGYKSIKLKGGVFEPFVEVETILALHDAFPDQPLRIDPNAAWTTTTSLEVARQLTGRLEYLEDPTGGLDGMATVAKEGGIPLATNMAVTGFEDIPESVRRNSCQIILADHHYWGGLRRSMELARVCATFGLGLSMHSNSHLGLSLAAMVHFAAAVPEIVYAYDTHQPWQADEEILVGGKIPIVDGNVSVPTGPGLGVELDKDALMRLNERYERCGLTERDDVSQMRKYDPEWRGSIPRF